MIYWFLTIFICFSGCTNIFLEHGSYGNQDCVDAINDLQKYLTSNVPLTIFEHLAEDRNSCTRNHNPLIIWSKDQRIKLGLFLHPSIRKFTVDNKGNELMLSQVSFQPIPNVWIHVFVYQLEQVVFCPKSCIKWKKLHRTIEYWTKN